MRLNWRHLMSFHVTSLGPFRQEQVRVRLSPAFNRRAHPDVALERSIDAVWREYKEQSPRLFNATKFRLHGSHSVAGAVAASVNAIRSVQPSAALVLDWGLTDYKTYLGTCCSVNASRFVADSQALNGADAFAYLSRKVGVAAVVETSDAKIALIKRSKSVGVYQDMYDTPGGHPEPSHIDLTPEVLSALPHIDPTTTAGSHSDDDATALEREVVREFFASIVNEVHEEINVAPTDLSAPPLLLGVVLQAQACTPSFTFYLRTALTAVQVTDLYCAGPADVFESSKLELIDAHALLASDAHAPLTARMTPSAQGSLELWRNYVLQQQQAPTHSPSSLTHTWRDPSHSLVLSGR